jgi:hypothetical protein
VTLAVCAQLGNYGSFELTVEVFRQQGDSYVLQQVGGGVIVVNVVIDQADEEPRSQDVFVD